MDAPICEFVNTISISPDLTCRIVTKEIGTLEDTIVLLMLKLCCVTVELLLMNL